MVHSLRHPLLRYISAHSCNLTFNGRDQNENDPCKINQPQAMQRISELLSIPIDALSNAIIVQSKVFAGEVITTPLTEKQCQESKNAMAKSIYENVFEWIVKQLNSRLGGGGGQIKLLDIYGFQSFQKNSFEQLCVNYTNEKMHQMYLEQVFQKERSVLKKEGLEEVFSKLNFTDNAKIIELLDTLTKSVFNLLDESCSLNVTDRDYLANVRKHHQSHEHFPSSNTVNTRDTFKIKHTPGEIQYEVEGFRNKNKDLLREDILLILSKSKNNILRDIFSTKLQQIKNQKNQKRFLGSKIRKQVKELIQEMSTNSRIHFIRCIKPNEKKQPFGFQQRVCYNQIQYLGILDTVRLRKQSYHSRIGYSPFYAKYGILQPPIDSLIELSKGELSEEQIKGYSTQLLVNLKQTHGAVKIDYLLGRELVFLKMDTLHLMEDLLQRAVYKLQWAATRIKVQRKHRQNCQRKQVIRHSAVLLQKRIRMYLSNARKNRRIKAVKCIEREWIKRCEEYFRRKRLRHIHIVQRYIRKNIEKSIGENKVESVRKAKEIIRSINKTREVKQMYQMRVYIRELIMTQIMLRVWVEEYKICLWKLEKYLLGYNTIVENKQRIKIGQQIANNRLSLKYRKSIQKYIKGCLCSVRYNIYCVSVVKVQSNVRTSLIMRQKQRLNIAAWLIQRNWREYHSKKYSSMQYTAEYFSRDASCDYRVWSRVLHRNGKPKLGIEAILQAQSKCTNTKIALFYYLLDCEVLCDVSLIYPGSSWVDNYVQLQQVGADRNNPIQYVEVSDQHTVCASVAKVFVWGVQEWGKHQQYTMESVSPVQLSLPPNTKLEKVQARNGFTVVHTVDGPLVYGNRANYQEDALNKWNTLNESYVVINGVLVARMSTYLARIPIAEKVTQLSCGMNHCIARTSLRKVFTWGSNEEGQLGHGHTHRIIAPKQLQLNLCTVSQVSACARGSILLDNNCKLWWWGTNNTIHGVMSPRECPLYEKSEYLDDPQKYAAVRIICSWSKSMSIIGVTMAAHAGVFKSAQSAVRKKTYESLMNKWGEDLQTINPVFMQPIAGYFLEKHMPKPTVTVKKDFAKENQRIREKLMAELQIIQREEQILLQQKYGKKI